MLKELIKARVPAIFIKTSEEIRIQSILSQALQGAYNHSKAHIFLWSPTKTSTYSLDEDTWADIKIHKEFEDVITYDSVLRLIKPEESKINIMVYLGTNYLLDKNLRARSYESIYRIMEMVVQAKQAGDSIILTGSHNHLPDELSKLFYVCDIPLPDLDEIEDTFKIIVMEYVSALGDKSLMKSLLAKVHRAAQLAQGLTLMEAENAFTRSLQIHNDIDFPLLIKHKASAIAQSDVLELMDTDNYPMDNVVGFDAYKKWLELRSLCFSSKQGSSKLKPPKGVILTGFPGAGKSMVAKATGNFLGLPVIRFDFSRVFRSLVGDSEEMMERTLKIFDAVSPAVVFIDEINLSMGGASSTTVSDSGVMLKLLQMFLTWQQEFSKVFIVATANSLDTLPPMLYRKGRMDMVYFCNLPDEKQRKSLFETHLRLQGYSSEGIDLDLLVGRSTDYSGAEIEHAISDAMFLAAYNDGAINTSYILEALHNIKPNSGFLGESFNRMVQQFNYIGVIDASTGEPVRLNSIK